MKRYLLVLALVCCKAPEDSKTKAPPPDFHLEADNECGEYYQRCSVLHDDKRHVTCWAMWQTNGNALQCLPDWQLSEAPATKLQLTQPTK